MGNAAIAERPSLSRKPRDISQEGIVVRLENWGSCQRGRSGGAMISKETRNTSPYGGQGYKCMTDVVCTMMRMAANGPSGGHSTQSRFDFMDSGLINDAWKKLGPRHRLLLRDLYVLNRPVHIICHELSIRYWPARHWNLELEAAQSAISILVGGKEFR